MQAVDAIPVYLAPALGEAANRKRRRAICATARSLQSLPLDTALAMVHAVYLQGMTLSDQREASAVGWLLLNPAVLTDLEHNDGYAQS